MSWLFSQALVAEFSEATCWDGAPSALSSSSPTPQAFLPPDRMTAFSRPSRSGMTFGHLTEDLGEALLTWFLADSRVRTYQLPGMAPESTVSDQAFGEKWHESSVRYDRDSSSWRTHRSLFEEALPWSSVTLPNWGMTLDGVLWEPPTSGRPISGIASGLWQTPVADDAANRADGKWNSRGEPKLSAQVLLWPTPTVFGNYNLPGASPTSGMGLASAVKLWPTPVRRDYRAPGRSRMERTGSKAGECLPQVVGGQLNPEWVELLMGWPKGFTALVPLPREELHAWAKGFAGQNLQDMRSCIQSTSNAEWSASRCEIVPSSGTLQQDMREQQKSTETEELSMESSETSQGHLRGLRIQTASDSASLRSRPNEQRPRKPADLMQPLPRLLARYGKKAWQEGSWEDGVPRIGKGIANRVDRIKALGNGQVPRVASTAFTYLASDWL